MIQVMKYVSLLNNYVMQEVVIIEDKISLI